MQKKQKEKAAQNRVILAERQFERCLEKIEEAVSVGKTHAEMYDEGNFYTSTHEKLKALGYKVKGCRIIWE